MRFHSLRTAVLFGLVALALMANGKNPIAAAQLAPPASPSVALSASPASAQAGQPVTLTWSSTNATSVTLEPSVGGVASQGSTTVRPSQSTTYTITATGAGGSAHASAQAIITPAPPPAAVREPSQEEIPSDQRQLRGLDEQLQEIKSDALRMSAELSQLEEKLLYPSGTQVAIFVALAKGDTMRLDAVRLQIDGQLVAHYIYSAKELKALRKGGVQRIYVGNVATGDHKLDVLVDGKLEDGVDFSRTGQFTFRKEVKPRLIGLSLALGLAARSATGADLRDLYFGEALYHAYQGQYFDALQRLDTELAQYHVLDEPELDTLHYHINDAEFSVGDFELNYRMHQRAGRAIKAVLEGAVDEAVRNEAAFRLARIHFQKGQLDDALQALARIKGTVPEEIRGDVEFLRANVYMAKGQPSEAVKVLAQLKSNESLAGFVAYNLAIARLQDGRTQEAIEQLDKAGRLAAGSRRSGDPRQVQ